MMNMIPQNDNFASYDMEGMLCADDNATPTGGDDTPPLEVPDQNTTPKDIPEKSIN